MKSVNALPCRLYNPSVFLLLRSKNPAPLAQGSRETHRKPSAGTPYRVAERHSVNAIPYQGIQPLSHGVSILNRRASSPCTGEPTAIRVQRRPDRSQLPLHRGAEVCPPSEWCEPRTREPRTAAEPPSQKQKNKPSQSGGEKKIFFLKGER